MRQGGRRGSLLPTCTYHAQGQGQMGRCEGIYEHQLGTRLVPDLEDVAAELPGAGAECRVYRAARVEGGGVVSVDEDNNARRIVGDTKCLTVMRRLTGRQQ